MDKKIISVFELNTYIKNLLNSDTILSELYIKGEISNFKLHNAGHMYFTIKDENAAVSCVMFRSAAGKMKFSPENGMKVLIRGRVDLFIKNGQYQLYAEELIPEGIGDLAAAFEQLKEKLHKEGLFDSSLKKPLPRYPEKIGIVTSPTGAAVRDMLRILKHRYPIAKILICPVLVQGPRAAEEIAAAIAFLSRRRAVDLIITGRGGGSMEDLWAFNEEVVARAIHASAIPVISAVGHEPDITISDLVADVRAATPSNAAEIAVPDRSEIAIRLSDIQTRLHQSVYKKCQLHRQFLSLMASKPVILRPAVYVHEKRQLVDHLQSRMQSAAAAVNAVSRRRFVAAASALEAMSPLKVLGRGYAITRKPDGSILKDSADTAPGERIIVRLCRGELHCEIKEIDGGINERTETEF